MANEGSYVALGLNVWKAQIERADKLFGGLSSGRSCGKYRLAGTGFFICGDI